MAFGESSVRILGIIVLLISATLIHAIGLLSPLTPSEGIPSAISLVVFGLVPFLMCLLAGKLAKTGKVLFTIYALFFLVVPILWLYVFVKGLMPNAT